MLGLENWLIPETNGLYVSLLYGPDTVIGNNNGNTLSSDGSFTEVQSTAMLHQIDIDVMSYDNSARLRKQDVLWAIQSSTAAELMEKYGMRLASTPGSFVPISSLEPTKQLNRFRLSVAINAIWVNVISSGYFDAIQKVDLVVDP